MSRANSIKYGFESTLVDVRLVEDAGLLSAQAHGTAIHHLGHVGEHEFFFVPRTDSVVYMRSSEVAAMRIHDEP
ncbi:MAG TPA: hypothetical protein VJ323_04870, partial [Bryobacteraceae bacterium]|nr:hypothetical protein [Bryobacteraceae bacterium]